jgi:hypothetical protein
MDYLLEKTAKRGKVKYVSEMPIFEIAFVLEVSKTIKGPQGL